MDTKLKCPKSTSFQLSLKLCWMKIALFLFEVFELEVWVQNPKNVKLKGTKNNFIIKMPN